jgi:diguanylate cyclase (GGDEF)-like protein
MRFRSLSTRLTVQFALLFAGCMLGVSLALTTIIARSVSHQVETELQSSGAVYDRLWQQRARELQGASNLLAHDFGFRAAVATGDEATMASALDNVKARVGMKTAFIIGIDGGVHGVHDPAIAADAKLLWNPLDEGRLTGISMLGGKARQLVAAPILAPNLIGWMVFAADLDRGEMYSLERLSAIPLNARVLMRRGATWIDSAGTPVSDTSLVEGHLRRAAAFDMTFGGERAIALAKPLTTFAANEQAVLLLAYPRAEAMAAGRTLQWTVGLMALIGLLLVVLATWRAAGRITLPLARLDEAAGRLASGAPAQVPVDGKDELARLAASFNAMVREIEERERRITHLAFNDVLTGLPNRSMFQQHLDHLLGNLEPGNAIALHCLDLDHFKTVNDSMGHPAGDALLVATADKLKDIARGHFVARLGGDEFVVIQQVVGERHAIDQLAGRLIEGLARPVVIEGKELVVPTSIGIALAPADGRDSGALLKNADLALYRAKEAGRSTYAYFESSLNERAQARRELESDLRNALERGEFELHYQPLFDLEKERISSFEALLRWNHPRRGLISPVEFIPVAEDTGLIVPIGAWAMREACRQATHWPDQVRVGVNVSSIQFHRPGLNEVILQSLAASGLAPHRLEIEITESVFLEGGETTLNLLHSLRTLGVRIALDDFGTGYSSLSYLQSFPFDKLKIDQSFIRNLLTRPGAAAVVRAITELAGALGMETTAEGVEESAQLNELKLQGCSSVQGFLFSRPLTATAVQQLFDGLQQRVA